MDFSEDFVKALPNIPDSDDGDEPVEIYDVSKILEADKLNKKDFNCRPEYLDKTIGDLIKDQEAELMKISTGSSNDNNFVTTNGSLQCETETDTSMITNVGGVVDDIWERVDLDKSTITNKPNSIPAVGKQDRSKVPLIDLRASKTHAGVSKSEKVPVDDIWDFINSQEDAAKRLAIRKEKAEREYQEHKAWCERQAKAKANYVPDPAIGDFVNNEITFVSLDESSVEEVSPVKKPLEFNTPEEAEQYYKTAAQALLQQRLALEARKLEEERLANLEIARKKRIKARMEEAEYKRKQQAIQRARRKYDAMMKVLLESAFPVNGELFYSQNISHQEPVSCLPHKKNIWENHIHLTCTLASWALPTVSYCISLGEFRAIQLSHSTSEPRVHLVLECSQNSQEWEAIRNAIPPNGVGVTIGDSFRVVDDHDVFDLSQLSLYSRATDGEQPKRLLERPNIETCIGIFRNIKDYDAVLEVLKSPAECGAKLVGMRTAYLTEKQKKIARPMFNVSIDSFDEHSPLLVLCISGTNCREEWDNFLGPLDPQLARRLNSESIRARFGQSKDENVIWVSRTFFKIEPKTVRAEAAFFFAGRVDGDDAEAAENASKRIISAMIPLR